MFEHPNFKSPRLPCRHRRPLIILAQHLSLSLVSVHDFRFTPLCLHSQQFGPILVAVATVRLRQCTFEMNIGGGRNERDSFLPAINVIGLALLQ